MRSVHPVHRAIVGLVARWVPAGRRDDWRREWLAELASQEGDDFSRRGSGGGARTRHVWACFADARELRRLARSRAATPALRAPTARHALGGARWHGFQPVRAVRHAFKSLAGNPVFSVAAIVTLALGIGANTAIFSLVNAAVFKPPAVRQPDELVRVYTSTPEGQPFGATSYLELQDIAAQVDAFDGVVGYALVVGGFHADGRLEGLLGEAVTGNYFDVLGVPMALGRAFRPEEDSTPGTHPVVVLGHGFWTRRFGADPSVVGSTIRINGVGFDVIGVAAPEYRGMLPGLAAEFWAPSMMMGVLAGESPDALTSRRSRQFLVHARLRQGATVEQAQSALSLVADRLARAFPDSNEGHTMTVVSADEVRFHPRIDRVVLPIAALLLCVPGLVLLIACTNLAGLLLARATDRRKEIAVRLALGARRRHIVGQLLGESLLLSLIGGALGVLLAAWFVELAAGFKPPIVISLSLDLSIDYRVLLFTLATAMIAGLLFGLLPALRSSKPDLSRSLKDDDAVAWRSRRFSLRDALIVGQVAVSMMLLLIAGLFVRSLQMAQTIDPGFDTDRSVVFTMNAAPRYDATSGPVYYRELVERLSGTPGVTSVALADRLPLGLSSQTMHVLPEQGLDAPAQQVADAESGAVEIDFGRISAGYFRTLDIDLLSGRDFAPTDSAGSSPVAIVSQAAVDFLWAGESPIGRRLRRPGAPPLEIVGVARDTRVRTLGEAPRPYLYVPFDQSYESAMELIIATDREPREFLALAQEVILQVDPDLMPLELMTMAEGSDFILFPVRAAAGLMGAFGALGLLLSAVGIFGSLAYSVAQRAHEVGVRLALGATPSQLVRMVVAGGMRRVAAGMVVGVLLTLAAGRLLEGLLVGISPVDPVAFAVVGAMLALVAGVASYLPARRAAAADPLVVLRNP